MNDILITYVDGLKNSLKYLPWKDNKAVRGDLKRIYQSVTEEETLLELDNLCLRWYGKYPQISRSWRAHWLNLNTLFKYPQDILKTIYTRNAIEYLNNIIRKAIKKRKLFPSNGSARKVFYLAIDLASKKWTMPIRNWKTALDRFMVKFEDRLKDFI